MNTTNTPSALSLRGRLYFASDVLVQRLQGVLTATQSLLWLGLLDSDEFRQVTLLQYERWSRYRRDDHNHSGLFAWEESSVADYFPKQGKLLIAASGGGREALALSSRGYTITCFDCAPELVAHSVAVFAEAQQPITTYCALPGETPRELRETLSSTTDPTALFDGAIIGWGGFMHIHGRANRIAFLRSMADMLKPGAPLLLSFFARSRSDRFYRIVTTCAQTIRALRRKPTDIEIGDMLQTTFDHHFTDLEIESELAQAGLRMVTCKQESFPHAVAIKEEN